MKKEIEISDLRDWFSKASTMDLEDFLEAGLEKLIEILEEDDFFGTEGFNKRFA